MEMAALHGPSSGGSSTGRVSGRSHPISQFVIPPLHGARYKRREDWEPVFRTAVTLWLFRQDGQKFAIGLLPDYVNR